MQAGSPTTTFKHNQWFEFHQMVSYCAGCGTNITQHSRVHTKQSASGGMSSRCENGWETLVPRVTSPITPGISAVVCRHSIASATTTTRRRSGSILWKVVVRNRSLIMWKGFGTPMGKRKAVNIELKIEFGRHAAIDHEIREKGGRGTLVLKQGGVPSCLYPHREHECESNGITLMGGDLN